MARGEPLANKWIINTYADVYDRLYRVADRNELRLKMNVSTIMPWIIRDHRLKDVFHGRPTHVYYSLYSMNDDFRRQWIPNAMPLEWALDKLKDYETSVRGNMDTPITFHWAYIKGHNDSVQEAMKIADLLKTYQFNAKFNLVRFNPHPNLSTTGVQEPSEERLKELSESCRRRFRILVVTLYRA